MKRMRLLLLSTLVLFLSLAAIGQSTIDLTTSGGSFATEKWVSITTAVDGGGTQVWGQGDGTYGNGAGYLTSESVSLAPGTYYVNCYDRYDDSWDGTLISVAAYGSVIGNNGGASPDDGNDVDASSSWDTPADELETSFAIVVPAAPSCLQPSALAATSTATSASLGWTEMGTATIWDIEYGVTGFTQGAGTMVTGTTTNPYALSTLTPSTTYDFYVKADCGGSGQSGWAGPYSFATSCTAFIAPYIESFDGTTTPSCWSQSATSGGPWLFGTPGFNWNNSGCSASTPADHTGNSGNYAALDFSTPDAGVILEMPTIDVSGLTTAYLELYHQMCTIGYPVPNETYIEAYDGTTWAQVALINTGTASWEKYGFDISSYVYNTNLVSLRFRAEEGSATSQFYGDVAIDDVSVIEAPTCLSPSNLTATNVTATGADLGWMANGTATTWDVEYGTAGFTQGAGTTVSTMTNPHVLSTLTANTSYDFYVRSDCGSGQSTWTGPFSFATACTSFTAPYTETFDNAGAIPNCWLQGASNAEDWLFADGSLSEPGHGGNLGAIVDHTSGTGYFAWINDSGPHNTGTTLESANVDISGLTNPALSFWINSDNEGFTNVDFSVDFYDGAAWNTAVYTSNTNTGGWLEVILDLSTYTITGAVKARFIVDENNGTDFYDDIAIDDVKFDEAPSCLDPINLTATNVTSTSADLGWTSSATIWDIEWGTAGFAQGAGTMVTGTTTNPYALSSLSTNTSYDFYVRTDCGIAGQSNWTGPYTFSTPCIAYTVPYFEGFETGYTDQATVAGCLSQESVTGANTWTANSTLISYNRGPRTGAWSSYLRYGNDDWLFIPITLTAATTYAVDAYAKQDGTTTTNADVAISYGTTNTAAGMTNTIVAATGISDTYQAITGTFTPITTGIYYIGIKGYMNGSPWYINLDDISVYELVLDDVGVSGTTIASTANCNTAESVTIDIYNYGLNAQTTFPVSYTVNGGAVVTETWTGSLASGMSVQHTFAATYDASVSGNYEISAYTALSSDVSSANDTMMNTTVTAPVYATTFVENFEAGTSLPADWSYNGSIGNVHNSQTIVIYKNMYSAGTNTFTTTLPKVGTLSTGTSLEFDYRYSDYNGGGTTGTTLSGDTLSVEVSADCGATFTSIGNVTVSNHVTSVNFARLNYDLSAYTGQDVIVRINATWDGGADYYLDLDSFYIGSPLAGNTMVISDYNGTAVSCVGSTDGAATAMGTNGTSPYTYLWDANAGGSTMDTITGLGAGMYSVTITDAAGALYTDSVFITEPAMTLTSTVLTDVNCFAGTDGSIDLSVSGGAGSYGYVWSNGDITEDLSNVIAGAYTVTITDANGCTTTETGTVNEPATALVVTTTTVADTNNLMIGEATAVVSGGTQPYTGIVWDNGMTGASISGLGAGIYVVTATDANGCTATASVQVDSVLTSLEYINYVTNLKIFPNPTVGNLTIDLELSEAKDVNVVIYDMAGQLIRDFGHEHTAQTQIRTDLSNFPSGVYLVRIVLDNQVITKRLIVSKR